MSNEQTPGLPSSLRVSVGGRYWSMEFGRTRPRMYGVPEAPHTKNKKIRIRQRLKEDVMLDTIIHELLHAAEWDAGEAWIEQIATHTSQVLILAGWQRKATTPTASVEQLRELVRTCLRLSKPHLDQDKWATNTAGDIAKVIWKLGWRCEP